MKRIEQFDSTINAITVVNPNALSIAKVLDDEYYRTYVLWSLHGIPLIVKDNINTKGLRTTAGSISLRVAFRKAIEDYMDNAKLDAFIYPTWLIKPYNKNDSIVEEYIGFDNSSVIAPHTGQPANTVTMGFMKENLPTGIEFLGRMYSEPVLIKLAYSYEQGTKHRAPPDLEKAITKDKMH